MRTPAGKECKYFYGDYYRGRQNEECRLLAGATPPLPWKPGLCNTCIVPGITIANACPNMVINPHLARPFPFLKQRVEISTTCLRSRKRGFDPHVGCGNCHILPDIFSKLNDPDTAA